MSAKTLSMYTICFSPLDFPGEFTLRRHEIGPGWTAPRELVARGATLDQVRRRLPPGLHCLGREPDDEAQIVETWI